MTQEKAITFAAVPHDRLDAVWPLAKRHLERAAKTTDSTFSIDDVEKSVRDKTMILWVVMRMNAVIAAFTTRVLQYPKRKALTIDWVGGSRMREWIDDAHTLLIDLAKRNGCSHLEGYGVRAWGRVGSKWGWKQAYITYRMEL